MDMSMGKYISIASGVVLLIMVATIYTLWAESNKLNMQLGGVIAANEAQQRVAVTLREMHQAAEKEVAEAKKRIAETGAASTYLEGQLRRALRAQKSDTVTIAPDVSRALCLRYLSATGRLPRSYGMENTGGIPAGSGDSVAAFCSSWDLTAEDMMLWLGDILDAFGSVRIRVEHGRVLQQ